MPETEHASIIVHCCRWFEGLTVVLADKIVSKRIDGQRAFSMPVSEKSGFNWIVKASEGRILGPAVLMYSPASKCYLLDKSSEKLSVDQALLATSQTYKDARGRPKFSFVGLEADSRQGRMDYMGDGDEGTGGQGAEVRRNNIRKAREINKGRIDTEAKRMRGAAANEQATAKRKVGQTKPRKK